jgi:Tfp pilus assembly protein PilF
LLAAGAYWAAVALRPDSPVARSNLGNVLRDLGDRDRADACYKKAIDLEPRYVPAYVHRGALLLDQGDRAGAAECYKKALELDPRNDAACSGLGAALLAEGDRVGAAVYFKKDIELNPRRAGAQINLGNVLRESGDLAGAAQCFKKAAELDPKNAMTPSNLGDVLLRQGKFAEAQAAFRRCLDLAGPNDPLRAAAADKVARCDRLLALEARLGPVLRGEQKPTDDAERLGLAEVCRFQGRYAAAARLYHDAFAHNQRLADSPQSHRRFDAACCAARAGCGMGEDAGDLDEKARADRRKQALDWLHADLEAWAKRLEGGSPADPTAAAATLRHWRETADLSSVRDAAELEKLPAEERQEWARLWADVQALLDKAETKK